MDERERMKISDIKEVLKYQLYLINYTHNSQVFARIWYIIFIWFCTPIDHHISRKFFILHGKNTNSIPFFPYLRNHMKIENE